VEQDNAHSGLKARRENKRSRQSGVRTPRLNRNKPSPAFTSAEPSSADKTNDDMGISNLPTTAALSSPPPNALDLPELDHGTGTERGDSIEAEDKRRAGSHKRKRKTDKQLACL